MGENREVTFYRNTIVDIFDKISAQIETIQSAAEKMADAVMNHLG